MIKMSTKETFATPLESGNPSVLGDPRLRRDDCDPHHAFQVENGKVSVDLLRFGKSRGSTRLNIATAFDVLADDRLVAWGI